MPRGSKQKYTDKEKRQAEHIEEGYEERGVPEREAERRAWADGEHGPRRRREARRRRIRQARESRADAQGWEETVAI